MKKFVMVLCLFLALIVMVLGNVKADNISMENLYPLCGVVIELDYQEDIFVVIDGAGMIWLFTECEDWQIGDLIAMIVFDNFTPYIQDDIVLNYRYCGYCANCYQLAPWAGRQKIF